MRTYALVLTLLLTTLAAAQDAGMTEQMGRMNQSGGNAPTSAGRDGGRAGGAPVTVQGSGAVSRVGRGTVGTRLTGPSLLPGPTVNVTTSAVPIPAPSARPAATAVRKRKSGR